MESCKTSVRKLGKPTEEVKKSYFCLSSQPFMFKHKEPALFMSETCKCLSVTKAGEKQKDLLIWHSGKSLLPLTNGNVFGLFNLSNDPIQN